MAARGVEKGIPSFPYPLSKIGNRDVQGDCGCVVPGGLPGGAMDTEAPEDGGRGGGPACQIIIHFQSALNQWFFY